jgi:hypothetical protein
MESGSFLIGVGILGAAVWTLPKFLIGRSETELDNLERSYFNDVIVNFFNDLIINRDSPDRPISSAEIEDVKGILDIREDFRYNREQARNFKYYTLVFYIGIVISLIMLDQIEFTDYRDLIVLSGYFIFIFFLAYLSNYISALRTLSKDIQKMSDRML